MKFEVHVSSHCKNAFGTEIYDVVADTPEKALAKGLNKWKFEHKGSSEQLDSAEVFPLIRSPKCILAWSGS